MAWNTTGNNTTTTEERFVHCNGNQYNITGLQGQGLVQKLKDCAKQNDISKFDVLDSNQNTLSPADIESGNFTGDLSLVRFNVAA